MFEMWALSIDDFEPFKQGVNNIYGELHLLYCFHIDVHEATLFRHVFVDSGNYFSK